ncbi:hypothetical protein EVAR_67951_1 [Eumeta japonica]|uniref:Uncharacterized protein n=1 Tax=Eumeta variegata TaxID=151549 RepID=A0A4C2A2A4_EUMVA|nr:hypothetical protein EVAR_67951_1 [Eumeta japonica]
MTSGDESESIRSRRNQGRGAATNRERIGIGLDRDVIRTRTGDGIERNRNEKGRRAESRMGPESETKAKLEPKLRTGLKSKTSAQKIVTGIRIENDTRIEIDIDRYKRKNSSSMLVQLVDINYKGKATHKKVQNNVCQAS